MYTRSFTSLYASGTAETNNIVKNLYFHKNFKIKKKKNNHASTKERGGQEVPDWG